MFKVQIMSVPNHLRCKSFPKLNIPLNTIDLKRSFTFGYSKIRGDGVDNANCHSYKFIEH